MKSLGHLSRGSDSIRSGVGLRICFPHLVDTAGWESKCVELCLEKPFRQHRKSLVGGVETPGSHSWVWPSVIWWLMEHYILRKWRASAPDFETHVCNFLSRPQQNGMEWRRAAGGEEQWQMRNAGTSVASCQIALLFLPLFFPLPFLEGFLTCAACLAYLQHS